MHVKECVSTHVLIMYFSKRGQCDKFNTSTAFSQGIIGAGNNCCTASLVDCISPVIDFFPYEVAFCKQTFLSYSIHCKKKCLRESKSERDAVDRSVYSGVF